MSPIILPSSSPDFPGATRAGYKRLVKLKGYDGAGDTQLNDAIEEARRRLVTDHRWNFLQTRTTSLVTAPGNDSVSLVSLTDLAHVDAVRTSLGGCDFMPYQELRTYQKRYPASEMPQVWTRASGKLILYPTPDVAYSLDLDYAAKLAPLPDDATPDVIPDELQDLVAWAAVPTFAFRQRDQFAMAAAEQKYAALLRMAVSQENIQQRESSQQVRSGYWGTPR